MNKYILQITAIIFFSLNSQKNSIQEKIKSLQEQWQKIENLRKITNFAPPEDKKNTNFTLQQKQIEIEEKLYNINKKPKE